MRRKRIHRHAHIPQNLHPDPNRKCDRPERIPELQPMVPFARIIHLREPFCISTPIELPAVNDHSANGSAVPAYPFRSRMHNNIRSMIKRPTKVAPRAKRVVYNDRNAMFMRHSDNGFEIRDVVARITNTLQVNSFRLLIDQFLEFSWIIALHKLRRYPKAWESDFELIVCATIQVRGTDDIIPCMSQGGNNHQLCCLPRRGCNGCGATFESSNSLFEYIDGGLYRGSVHLCEHVIV